MVRIAVAVVFSLSARIFSAPTLCTHTMADMDSVVAVESNTMTHCHESISVSENTEKKYIPCKHMAQCLIDAGHEDPFQKSGSTAAAEFSILSAFYVPSMTHYIYSASSETPVFHTPPPDLFSSDIQIYIAKSSFLI